MSIKQRVVRWAVGSFGNPKGIGGRIAAVIMGHRDDNVRRSRWAVGLLDLQPTDRFLEVGCGPGVALAAAKQHTPHVTGIDRADLMVGVARRRSGATVLCADAVHLPPLDEPVDKVLAINTLAFWSDPVAGLRAVRRAMSESGTIAVVSQPRGGEFRDNDLVQAQLADAGFVVDRVETLDAIDPAAVAVLARCG